MRRQALPLGLHRQGQSVAPEHDEGQWSVGEASGTFDLPQIDRAPRQPGGLEPAQDLAFGGGQPRRHQRD